MLKLLVDESLPRSSAKLLRSLGHDALLLEEVGLKGALDDDIFEYAQAHRRIIITRDLGFGNLLDYPLGTHCGIIVLRVPYFYTANEINAVLNAFIREVESEKLKRALTIVQPGRYRIRRPKE